MVPQWAIYIDSSFMVGAHRGVWSVRGAKGHCVGRPYHLPMLVL